MIFVILCNTAAGSDGKIKMNNKTRADMNKLYLILIDCNTHHWSPEYGTPIWQPADY
jgi:hypothetical protein